MTPPMAPAPAMAMRMLSRPRMLLWRSRARLFPGHHLLDPGYHDLLEDFRIAPAAAAPGMAALRIDPAILRRAVLQLEDEVADRHLRVLDAVDQQHRSRWLVEEARILERKTRPIGEELVERLDAIDRRARRKE